MADLKVTDGIIFDLIEKEKERQKTGLCLIPSENFTSSAVKEAVGSVFENKYAEGYPGKRYYTGNQYVDSLEKLCIDRAKKLFDVAYVNVQAHSGSPANLYIMASLCGRKDIVLSQDLSCGGHLSMGQKASFTGRYYKAVHYHLNNRGEIDFEELEKLALKYQPKIIFSGGTGYTKIFKWKIYSEIAKKVKAFFVADISHIAGLVAGGAHPSPCDFADIIMTTTHKTLRGARGALIMVTQKGIKKDPDLPKKIDYAVFPGHQGGPHMNNIAGIAVALKEASKTSFKEYAKQIVINSRALSKKLASYGFTLVGGISENHMVWINLSDKNIDGWQAHITLEKANIFGNKQTVPFDSKSPFYPSGYRIGTPALTTRGMKENDMEKIAEFIDLGLKRAYELKTDGIGSKIKEVDQSARKEFKKRISEDKVLDSLKKKVIDFASKFPLP